MDETEHIELLLQVFEGLEKLTEELELLQCVFGEQEDLLLSE